MPSAGNRGPAGLAELRCWPPTMASLPYGPAATELVTPSADRAHAPAATHSRPRPPARWAPAHPAPGPGGSPDRPHLCTWAMGTQGGRRPRRTNAAQGAPTPDRRVTSRSRRQLPGSTCRRERAWRQPDLTGGCTCWSCPPVNALPHADVRFYDGRAAARYIPCIRKEVLAMFA